MSEFPLLRLRRLRRTENFRRLIRETRLSPDSFVYPLFIAHGYNLHQQIPSMPGISRFSPDLLQKEVEEIVRLDIPAVLIFGLPSHKDEEGSEAYALKGITQEAIRAIKKAAPKLIVITDVCLCEYTNHGHCGVLVGNDVDNDRTLELLAKTAISHAEAGADMVAPSSMMDGQISAIRSGLDKNGFTQIPIMAYAAKHASAFYGPFRDAAESTPQFGDRRGYQMDPANAREAMREVELDISEGADILMVKPALAYLDIISQVKSSFAYPVAAYNVSGEYSMVKAAALNGWLDERRAIMEVLTAIKRAGADIIITYHAKEVAGWLKAY